jgi:hypothetical protein
MHSLIQIDLARSLAAAKAESATKHPAPRKTRRRRALRRRRWSSLARGFRVPSKRRRSIEIG